MNFIFEIVYRSAYEYIQRQSNLLLHNNGSNQWRIQELKEGDARGGLGAWPQVYGSGAKPQSLRMFWMSLGKL